MAQPLATVDDVSAAGFDVAGRGPQLQYLLRLGSAVVRQHVPTVDERIASGDLDAQVVADVVVAMVMRSPAITNPAGVRSQTVGGETETYFDQAQDGLFLTPSEVALLGPTTPAAAKVRTARLAAGLA